MDLVLKTMEKVVISITTKEIESKGFEHFWDKIRRAYPAEKYDVHSIGALKDNAKDIYIELVSKRLHE
jgi:hypothetical protein